MGDVDESPLVILHVDVSKQCYFIRGQMLTLYEYRAY